jgi:hypothetical protein
MDHLRACGSSERVGRWNEKGGTRGRDQRMEMRAQIMAMVIAAEMICTYEGDGSLDWAVVVEYLTGWLMQAMWGLQASSFNEL